MSGRGRRPKEPKTRCVRPGCSRQIPAHMLACRPDWFALPPELRDRIMAHWQPGQNAVTASDEYWAALQEVLDYWERLAS